MGLGAPRKRAKLSHDPNNTTWSRSTTNYGHKMLLSQGWTPGSLLGAVDAPHAHLHSDANASHIRVALKDDNLGLGAKRGSGLGPGECTGLDVFQGLLGRLNGKSELVLEKEQKSRDDLKRTLYAERKFGTLRFVSGGVLVGDRIQKLVEEQRLRIAGGPTLTLDGRRNDALHDQDKTAPARPNFEVSPGQFELTDTSEVAQFHGPMYEEHSPSSATRTKDMDDDELVQLHQKDGSLNESSKKATRAEKAQRRLERRQRKDARRAARVQQESAPILPHVTGTLDTELHEISKQKRIRVQSAPAVAVVPGASGRHAFRQRYIAQKKMALLDPKALNEILMVKS